MSTIATTADTPASRTPEGIAAIILGMLLFVFQDAMMKSLLGAFPVWPLLLVRAVVCSLVMVPLILYLGPPHRILTPLWPLHLARAILFAFGFSLYYAAFPFMTLAAVSTIFFAAPLITAVFASVFLKEHIGIHRISALVLGFVGVIIAMKPGADSFQWASVLPLICACSYATSQMLARRIGHRETAMVAGAYTIILAGLLVLPLGWALNALFDIGAQAAHLRWSWEAFNFGILPWLALLGDVAHVDVEPSPEVSAVAPRIRPDRLADTVIQLLAATHPGPLILLFDDAQWADEASAHLLGRIARECDERPWLLLVARRDGEEGVCPRNCPLRQSVRSS